MYKRQISELCHEFESDLKEATDKEMVDGHDFVAPTVLLNKLMSYNATLQSLFDSIFGDKQLDVTTSETINWDHLYSYTKEVAERQNKKVNLQLSGLDAPNLDRELVASLSVISTQLIRNAISHGIESPDKRKELNKNVTGTLSVALFDLKNDGYQFIFNDDGSGINFEKITEQAVSKGLIKDASAKPLSKSQLINLLFTSDISTSEVSDKDNGRGVGMASILKSARELGGSISVKSNHVMGTTFIINYPKELAKTQKIAA